MNEFRNENICYISDEYIIECFMKLDLCSLFSDIYCNKNHQENKCIKLKGTSFVFNEDGRQKSYTIEKGIETIIYHLRSIIIQKLLNKRAKLKIMLGDEYDDLNLRLCCIHDPIEQDYQNLRSYILRVLQ